MDFQQKIIALLERNTKLSKAEIADMLAIPPDPKLGDYALPCFKLGKNPKQAAEKLKAKIKVPLFVRRVEVTGPYLNFFIKPAALAEAILPQIHKQGNKYGTQTVGKGKNIVIDFSAPNIAKPFGIGHLRSTVIGNSLYKVYSSLGYKVTGVNHLGDWGTQFGKMIAAYQMWGDEKKLQEDPIKYMLDLYVKYNAATEMDVTLQERARKEFKNLEEGKLVAVKLWKQFRKLSLQEFQRIYDILDITFDSWNGEAFYNNQVDSAIKKVKKTKMSEGALIFDLEKWNMPPVLLRKSNGTTTYHTRDLATAFFRLKNYKPEKILYVVGTPQKLHFQQLFKMLEQNGIDQEKFVHVNFGLIRLPEGKMSTRKGRIIFLEEVLQKAVTLAEKIIKKKNPKLKNKQETAKIIGIGAIIFGDLVNDRVRDVTFDWDKILSFEGETAPYVQYTHARACSIIRKAALHKQKVTAAINFENINLAEELSLVKHLANFPSVLRKVAQTQKPHHLAHFLIGVSQAFNEFYHKCPVISEVKDQMKSRLLLVDCTRQVLENGLHLLGIKAPQEM